MNTSHGTAVAEIVHAMAPAAQLYLICVDTQVDLALAEQYANGFGVKIVNHSVSWFNTSRGDGTGAAGTPDATVADARAPRDPLGQRRRQPCDEHWSGTFTPDGSDQDVHDFSPGITLNQVTIQGGEQACAFLRWDGWPVTSEDYDLFLVRVGNDQIVAGSTTDQADGPSPPTEELCYTNAGATQAFGIGIVRWSAAANLRFDLVYAGTSSLQFSTTGVSISEPASSPAALAVGAACWQTGTRSPSAPRGRRSTTAPSPRSAGPTASPPRHSARPARPAEPPGSSAPPRPRRTSQRPRRSCSAATPRSRPPASRARWRKRPFPRPALCCPTTCSEAGPDAGRHRSAGRDRPVDVATPPTGTTTAGESLRGRSGKWTPAAGIDVDLRTPSRCNPVGLAAPGSGGDGQHIPAPGGGHRHDAQGHRHRHEHDLERLDERREQPRGPSGTLRNGASDDQRQRVSRRRDDLDELRDVEQRSGALGSLAPLRLERTTCSDVAGATGTTYTLTGADVGGTVRAVVVDTNQSGSNSASSAESAVIAGPPGAPTGVSSGGAGNGQATVSFTAPASNGGATVTSYTVTSSSGGKTASGVSSPRNP